MPRVLHCDPRALSAAALAEAARVLAGGGLVAFPTETVYGLGGLALDERALARIFAAKGRPVHHPLIAHVEDEAGARRLSAAWPASAARLARAFWPGPLTLVVERAPGVPAAVAAGTSSVAVRVPAHPVARALLAATGAPVAAPSANRYQGLSPTTAAHVVKELGNRVDLVLDGGPCDAGIESTVVDVRSEVPVVLRPGAVALSALRSVAPDVALRSADPGSADARPSPGMDARHYAPRAAVRIAPTREAAAALARSLAGRGAGVGLVVRADAASVAGARPEVPAGVAVRVLPDDAADYGRALYATLHDLDDQAVESIVVQAVPDDAAWWAVADCLARGSTPAR